MATLLYHFDYAIQSNRDQYLNSYYQTNKMDQTLKIGVVGPCGTGKSELVNRLKTHGYRARHIAQEHSFAPKMWQILSNPDILIYLQVSYLVTLQRKRFNWTENEFQEQIYRLRHARENADLIINTDQKKPEEILSIVLETINDLHLSSPDTDPPTPSN